MESASNENNKLEILCESGPTCSDNISTFIDGQAVQLEDGSTAYIYRTIKDNMDEQNIQSISLEDGSTAYIHQPTQSTAITQTELSIDESKSPQNFRCDQIGCGKLYSSSHHLRVHKRSHTGEKPYKCDWENCGKSFSTSYSLRSHIRVHTGEKPYNCTYIECGKAFKTAGDLQKHIRIHTGEKPYKCPFQGCGKAFTTTNICKVHIRTHTGERPYKCPFPDCEKMFKNSTNYKNHVRIHTGEKPFVCDYPSCNKRFTEYSSFYKHKVVHADDRKKSCARTMKRDETENKDCVYYKCSICGKAFIQRSLLENHKLIAHNKSDVLKSEEGIADATNKNELLHSNKQPISDNRTRYDKDTYTMEKHSPVEQSRVVLLPVTSIESKSSDQTDAGDTIAQVAAVVTASSGQQLALLSHDGSTQQFTIALTEQGSTLLMPHSENESEIDTSVKSDNQVVFIKDNTLQRIEASENISTSTSDATPINADIWLHQPQRDEITSIGVKEEICLKENDNMQYEGTSNTCEDGSSSDSIAYLEIGGAKYQLKIVTAENDDQDNDANEVNASNQPSTSETVVQTLQMWPESNKATDDKVKFSDLNFLTSNSSSPGDDNQSEKQDSAIRCQDNQTLSSEDTSLYDAQSRTNKKRKL